MSLGFTRKTSPGPFEVSPGNPFKLLPDNLLQIVVSILLDLFSRGSSWNSSRDIPYRFLWKFVPGFFQEVFGILLMILPGLLFEIHDPGIRSLIFLRGFITVILSIFFLELPQTLHPFKHSSSQSPRNSWRDIL